MKIASKKKKVLLAASAGGHWIQLLRLGPAFEGHEVVFLSTFHTAPIEVKGQKYFRVRDASMWNKWGLILQATQVLLVVARFRPDVVVTTGAAPGFFAIVFARLLRKRTIWIDSIANVEQMSLAGLKAKRWATHWLTQWPHLASHDGPRCHGSVI